MGVIYWRGHLEGGTPTKGAPVMGFHPPPPQGRRNFARGNTWKGAIYWREHLQGGTLLRSALSLEGGNLEGAPLLIEETVRGHFLRGTLGRRVPPERAKFPWGGGNLEGGMLLGGTDF